MKIKTHLDLKLKTQQALVLTLSMQQALYVLQLPIMDLVQWVQIQIEQNPLLQFDETQSDDSLQELDFENQGFEVLDQLDETFVQAIFPDEPESISLENLATSSISLHDHLMHQARGAFHTSRELALAEQIIGHLDYRGFIGDFEADPAILQIVQSFDPPGIAARDLRECLLIQLKIQNKSSSVAYHLIEKYFNDLLQYRLTSLAKQLRISVSEIQAILKKDVSSLDFHPAGRFHRPLSTIVIPDIIIEDEGNGLDIKINEAPLPRYTLSPSSFVNLSRHYTEGKWMEKILARRREILTKIVHYLLKEQAGFFSGSTQSLQPISMHEAARELQLHESTIARAVKDKYVACPRGLFPLRYFFPHTSATQDGKAISHVTAKQLLSQFIAKEDKKKPLSDQALARAMAQAGIPCARRTIAKYRRQLHIPPASHRKREG